ncbi:hypothetical protein PoB_005667900 [Plakobranchus ocellatus]|uniref:Uncharacterized protein n=1 Tax=Plakobranchus ocellatus TaxID=259542 RepID=A0AAV4CG76_9GAST|nr:hypothetical protein PoB_005667900 [Plakobranchus ocellatus]
MTNESEHDIDGIQAKAQDEIQIWYSTLLEYSYGSGLVSDMVQHTVGIQLGLRMRFRYGAAYCWNTARAQDEIQIWYSTLLEYSYGSG